MRTKKAALGRLFLLFLFRVKLLHLLVEFIVDMLAKPFSLLASTAPSGVNHFTPLFSSGLTVSTFVSSAMRRYVTFRCRCEETYFPRFMWPSTVSTSSEKISSLAGRTF